MFYTIYHSPLGDITLAADSANFRELHIEGDRYFKRIPDHWIRDDTHALLQRATDELAEYFTGGREHFSLPLKIEGTEFQQQAWRFLQKIPFGATVTYADIAASIGKPKAARAVGTAVGKNPICIIVPCHRVVASSGGLGGYVAGLDRKAQLLALERGYVTKHE